MKNIILIIFLLLASRLSQSSDKLNLYSNAPQVQEMVRIIKNNSHKCLSNKNNKFCKRGQKSPYKGTGHCYQYVKIALLQSGLTSHYLGGVSAIKAGKYLEHEGFINIFRKYKIKPVTAPLGSIFIYKTKNSRHGHIEIKTDYDEFTSDYIRYIIDSKLIGIYIKKDQIQRGKEYGMGNFIRISDTRIHRTRNSICAFY